MSLIHTCNLTGTVCLAKMSLQCGYPDFLVVHMIGLTNVKPTEMLNIGHISIFKMC